jgi:hypothetical protein
MDLLARRSGLSWKSAIWKTISNESVVLGSVRLPHQYSRFLILPAAGPIFEGRGRWTGECEWRHDQFHHAGGGIRDCRLRPNACWTGLLTTEIHSLGLKNGTRPDFHGAVLMGSERRNPGVLQAFSEADEKRVDADHDACGRLFIVNPQQLNNIARRSATGPSHCNQYVPLVLSFD